MYLQVFEYLSIKNWLVFKLLSPKALLSLCFQEYTVQVKNLQTNSWLTWYDTEVLTIKLQSHTDFFFFNTKQILLSSKSFRFSKKQNEHDSFNHISFIFVWHFHLYQGLIEFFICQKVGNSIMSSLKSCTEI